MLDIRELSKGLQDPGAIPAELESFLVESYGAGVDLRYERVRYAAALVRFSAHFLDVKKVAIARAPGWISLMGEHTDYNGLPVLTMAIERDIVILFAPRRDRKVSLINTSFWYPPRDFDIGKRMRPYTEGNWGNYLKCTASSLRDALGDRIRGIDGCVFGDVPTASGLSSSTALMAATAASLTRANGAQLDAKHLALMLAGCDSSNGANSYTPVSTAAALLAEPGSALKIEALPLAITSVAVPKDYSFVVCNSLVEVGEKESRDEAAELRVVECRLGVAVLNSVLGDMLGQNRNLTLLAGLRYMSEKRQKEAVEALPEGQVSLREISKIVGIPAPRLREFALKTKSGQLLREPRHGFNLRNRVMHVLSEGRRVEKASAALKEGDMELFGRLMNESHESSSKDYAIGTPEVDALASICREEGALGARLSGGGFGGCVVALVRDRDIPEFETSIISRYYHDYLQKVHKGTQMSVVALEDAIFPCKPSGGAKVLV